MGPGSFSSRFAASGPKLTSLSAKTCLYEKMCAPTAQFVERSPACLERCGKLFLVLRVRNCGYDLIRVKASVFNSFTFRRNGATIHLWRFACVVIITSFIRFLLTISGKSTSTVWVGSADVFAASYCDMIRPLIQVLRYQMHTFLRRLQISAICRCNFMSNDSGISRHFLLQIFESLDLRRWDPM